MNRWILNSDNFVISKNGKREALWTQGNGYLGVRAAFEESYIGEYRSTLINGVFNASLNEKPEIVVLPDTTKAEISINGERFHMLCGKCEEYHATLNMKTGEFIRSLKWTSPAGDCVRLEFKRIVSFLKKHIVAEKIVITPLNNNVKITVLTGINGGTTNSGVQHFFNPGKRVYSNGIKGLYTKTTQSEVEVAVHYHLNCDHEENNKFTTDRRGIYTHMEIDALKSECVTIEKIVSYASSRDFEYNPSYADAETVKNDGISYLEEAVQLGYDKLYTESEKTWQKFWAENAVMAETQDEFLNKAITFAQYHLHIMASEDDNRLGIGAKALTGEGYKGHSYWDTELFLLPYYIYTMPQIARNLLEYRYKLLDVSKQKAKKYGFIGAMYPWESAWIDDEDTVDEYGGIDIITGEIKKLWFAEKEIHVTSAIAYGVWHYYQATGDKEFMELYGNELVVLTALFWTSRVENVNGRYEILDVIGPDEYKWNTNNNAYTNYMAFHNMKHAQKILSNCSEDLYKKLSADYNVDVIKARIDDVIEHIYLPKAEEDGIISQFDGCKDLIEIDLTSYKNNSKVATIFDDFGSNEILERQMYKQADLVMLFYLMGNMFTKEEICANYKYYEERTLHDSSLSMCIHSLVASRCKMKEIADDMFFKACCVDLGDNTDNSDIGIHAASHGGIWLMLVQGYAGLDVNENGLYLNPVLPEHWTNYSFNIYYRGTKLKVAVSQDGCKIERLCGDEVEIVLSGKVMKF